jgi:hypothetical protein
MIPGRIIVVALQCGGVVDGAERDLQEFGMERRAAGASAILTMTQRATMRPAVKAAVLP